MYCRAVTASLIVASFAALSPFCSVSFANEAKLQRELETKCCKERLRSRTWSRE